MGRKDYRSIRNKARSGTSVGFPMTNAQRSMTGVASSISEECPQLVDAGPAPVVVIA